MDVDPIQLYSSKFVNLYMFSAGLKERQNPFDALSSSTRRAIVVLLALRGPMTVTQIANELKLTTPSVLRNLRILMDAGLIDVIPETAARRSKKYYVAVPYFSEHELKKVTASLRPAMSSLIEHYRQCLDESYARFLELVKGLRVSTVMSYFDERRTKLSFFQLFQSLVMRELMAMKAIPSILELPIPWAGYIVVKD